MPDVNFTLPHWFYWVGILAFPLIAMYLARKTLNRTTTYQNNIAYFIWLVGGFLGLHRFYLKNLLGIVFCALFATILFASSSANKARVTHSDSVANVTALESSMARNAKKSLNIDEDMVETKQLMAEAEADKDAESNDYQRHQRKLDKLTAQKQDIATRMSDGRDELTILQAVAGQTSGQKEKWGSYALIAFIAVIILMIADAILLPKMVAKANQKLAMQQAEADDTEAPELQAELENDSDFVYKKLGLIRKIDQISLFSGEYVAYWSVIAVFVYYYEVTVRYVFNSPTNWAHESMFLMFGMQYLMAGAYAYLTNSHVRVDIFYAKFSARKKAIVDIVTSVFFFIFVGTLLVTGLIFAFDSLGQMEVSFTEWAIQYWPIKFGMVVGAILLLLQGISKLLKDIDVIRQSNV